MKTVSWCGRNRSQAGVVDASKQECLYEVLFPVTDFSQLRSQLSTPQGSKLTPLAIPCGVKEKMPNCSNFFVWRTVKHCLLVLFMAILRKFLTLSKNTTGWKLCRRNMLAWQVPRPTSWRIIFQNKFFLMVWTSLFLSLLSQYLPRAGHLFLLAVPSKIIRTRRLRFSINTKEGTSTTKY